VDYEIEPSHGDFEVWPDGKGTLRLVEGDVAATIMPDVYERYRLMQPGALTRTETWWERYLSDPPNWRWGASARYYVVYKGESGEYEGYANYRIKDEWKNGSPNHTLMLMQLIATSPEARAALWRFCFNVDLMATVQARNFSAEEPVRWMLRDPRRLRVTHSGDFLWVRLVDVPAALSGRRYAGADRLVFEVADAFRPETSGRYVLEGGVDGATCARTDEDADIALSVADLGATYLGGVHFTTLAQAGRVCELTPGALRRADALFASEPQAWCCTPF
jgi:predicted acetyltransferase